MQDSDGDTYVPRNIQNEKKRRETEIEHGAKQLCSELKVNYKARKRRLKCKFDKKDEKGEHACVKQTIVSRSVHSLTR